MDLERLSDRFKGCLLGGAYGDALGSPVEFKSIDEIRAEFGTEGIRCLHPDPGSAVATVTDDTQMTLFTAEGILRYLVRYTERGIGHLPSMVHWSLLRWLNTQGEETNLTRGRDQLKSGWLISVPELHARRAPGNTCLAALRSATTIGALVDNDSKGCGAAMRAAPIGLAGCRGANFEAIFDMAVETSRLTHGHPSGYLPAGVFAVLIALAVREIDLDSALDQATALLLKHEGNDETHTALAKARCLASDGFSTKYLEARFSGGWTGEDALAITIYCCLTSHDFSEAVVRAVNHSGDSDSTGSLVGNLLGARGGMGVLPARDLSSLELRGPIEAIAGHFARAIGEPAWLETEEAGRLYPGW